MYLAISKLATKGVQTVDPYNIIEVLNSEEATRKYAEELSVDQLQELVEMSDVLCRNSVEEYKILVSNVLDSAFRRDTFQKLKDCQKLCLDRNEENIEQQIYEIIDDVMTSYSTANDIPPYSEVIDQCWDEIKSRQGTGYAGIPFKFPTLNEYVTIEKGELVVFAAEAKQGKSMLLLNCAIDLLKQDKSVLYLDSELNTRMFTARVLSHLSGVEYKRLVSGNYTEEEAQTIENARLWMKSKRFTHIYIPMFDLQSIYTAVKKVSHSQDFLDVLIVDYFKGKGEGDAFDSYQELGRFVDMVKNQIARGHGDLRQSAPLRLRQPARSRTRPKSEEASTICLIQDKTPDEIEADGPECGNKKLRVVLNRNGMQMAQGEYIDLFFDGNHIMYSEAKQHIPQAPF